MLSRRLSLRRHRFDDHRPSGPSDWYIHGWGGFGTKVNLDAEGYARFTSSHADMPVGYSSGHASSDGRVAITVGRTGGTLTTDSYRFNDKSQFPGNPSASVAVGLSQTLFSSILLRDRILMLTGTTSVQAFRQWPWTTTRGADIPVDVKLNASAGAPRIYTNGGRHGLLFRSVGGYMNIAVQGPSNLASYTLNPGFSSKFVINKTMTTASDFLWGRIASVGGGMSYLGLPDDSRLATYVPPGAASADVWIKKVDVRFDGGACHRDHAYLVFSMRYHEIRRGADGEPVGGITKALLSMVTGTVNFLVTVGPDGEMVVSNITSRRVNYAPWGYYALVDKGSTYELHINDYTDGVTEVDFPRVEITPHPQYFDGLNVSSNAPMVRKYGDYILIPTTEATSRIMRIRIDDDTLGGLGYIGPFPTGSLSSFQALENHGLLYAIVQGVVYQSQDIGTTWMALPSESGSAYRVPPGLGELVPF